MFYRKELMIYKVVTFGIFLMLVGLVACGKKAVKPTDTGLEKLSSEKPVKKEQKEKLEVTKIQKEVPAEARFEVKEVEETPALKDIYFEFDKSDLTPEAIQTLIKNAEWLKSHSKVKISVEGHCDERGTIEYNLALGQKRATSVRNYLVSLGIKAERISTISYGEEKPIDPGHNEEAWARNRRAHTVVIK